MEIAVIGGGFTGLTTSLRLQKKGYNVSLFEKESILGGLASGFKLNNWEWSLEKHYHHIFTSDKAVSSLMEEIGIKDDLFFKRPKTGTYFNNSKLKFISQNCKNIYPLDSAIDLLKLPYLSFFEKIRAGVIILFLKITPFWKQLETITAYNWLNRYMGKRAFKILFEPLFVGKFGDYAKEINMSWFWARIKKRSPTLGYIKGGIQKFIDCLKSEIEENKGKIFLNSEILEIVKEGEKFCLTVKNNGKFQKKTFDKVIVTLPTKKFLKITPTLPNSYKDPLLGINHLDSLNLILILKKPFLKNIYWLNINDKSFPFLALVDHNNFIESKNYGENHILYIGNYLPFDHDYFKKSPKELLDIFDPFLKQISQDYKENIIDYKMFHGYEGQTIVTTNYSKIKPSILTPWKNLYLANLDMVYPWDRGINYAIELGEKVSKLISN